MDLRTLILTLADEATDVNTASLAHATYTAIPADQRAAALAAALPYAIRSVLSGDRGYHPEPQPQPEPEGAPRATGRSGKVTAIREMWQRALRDIYPCAPGVAKRLGEFTAPELEYAAEVRERHAAAVLDNAARLRALCDAVKTEGVDRVDALPPATLAALLGGAA